MIPTDYIVSKINQYTKRPLKLRHHNAYNFECPICNEGKSAGKKRRGYFMVNEGYFYCHNCNRGWSAINWIQIVCNLTYNDILNEIKDFGHSINDFINKNTDKSKNFNFETLPEDSINLFDTSQINYYSKEYIVQLCLYEIQRRRLNTAINKPKSIYISLKDKIHKNRLCIPFYDEDNQIRFYQTRAILPKDLKDDKPKYLSKLNSDKRIYGINNINPNNEYIFIFEGPIDSMFVSNGVAICGLNLTDLQQQILQRYNLYQQIWVLDNQLICPESKEKTLELINENKRVFIWPKELKKYKDINDICVHLSLNEIPNRFLINNSFYGVEAKNKLILNQSFS